MVKSTVVSTELSALHTWTHLISTLTLWGMCGHPILQMGKLTQRFNNLPKVTAGKWRIWLQKPSESVSFTCQGDHRNETEKHTQLQFQSPVHARAQETVCIVGSTFVWGSRDPYVLTLEWPFNGLEHSGWLFCKGYLNPKMRDLDSGLKWSLRFFPT